MPRSKPNPLAVAAFLAWAMAAIAMVAYLSTGCSGATSPIPARDVGRALCSLEVVEGLPTDPKRVTVEDIENVVREYRACLGASDAGAL